MQKLHFSIVINAPKEKVWNTMLQDATYQQWSEAFHAGSCFEGSWEQGADIKFLALNDNGQPEGMISRIKENRPYEFVSIEHRGFVQNGKEDTTSDEVKKWAGALENYTFSEVGEGTEVRVDTDTEESFVEMFSDMWPKALRKLKEIAEK